MLHQIKSYLKFLFRSTSEHGIHSPFVFNLVTKCFYDKTIPPEYEILDRYREKLLAYDSQINVTDFGAGSRVFKSNKRHISDIARTAGISCSRARLLFRVTQYLKPEKILEIGTSVGLATSALSLGNPDAAVTTIEGCPETAAVAGNQFKAFGLSNVEQKITRFEDAFSDGQLSTFNFIFFDGNHQKGATLSYFETLLPTAGQDSVWIFDDIHWSPGMEQAWELIKKHPKATVTIDTFQWGFVFFRTGQEKQDFTIWI